MARTWFVYKPCQLEPVDCEEPDFGNCNSLPSGTCFRQQADFALAMMAVQLAFLSVPWLPDVSSTYQVDPDNEYSLVLLAATKCWPEVVTTL